MDGSIETYLLLGFASSVVGSVGGIVVVGVVLVRLPADYFARPLVGQPLLDPEPLAWRVGRFLKNLLGAALVALGLIMSVPGIPGPGILAIVIGVMLSDFAGKRGWAGWVIGRPLIFQGANGLRRRYGRPPFRMPPASNR